MWLTLVSLLLVAALSPQAPAVGSICGVIQDPTGAAIVGASVVLHGTLCRPEPTIQTEIHLVSGHEIFSILDSAQTKSGKRMNTPSV
jgi:hypothetical protein